MAVGNKLTDFQFTILENPIWVGAAHQTTLGQQEVILDLFFEVRDQESPRKEIEPKLMNFIEAVQGYIDSSRFSSYKERDSYIVRFAYSIKLYDYDAFLFQLEKYSRKLFEEQFTLELEVKLTED